MPRNPRQYRSATDGLRARVLGPHTLDKLEYVEKYSRAFMTAMAPKGWEQLIYLDLLAGPGLCIDRGRDQEHLGSPLRALNVTPKFDHLYFSDKNKLNIIALKARISDQDRSRVTIDCGDCNQLIRHYLVNVSPKTLGIALLDPAGFEVHFETLRLLSTKRIDILYLFPTGDWHRAKSSQVLGHVKMPNGSILAYKLANHASR